MDATANTSREVSAESSAEEKFRLAVEACPNGMVMTDGAGKIVARQYGDRAAVWLSSG